MPGSPLSYKEVIFEALKEWLKEEQVGQRITVVYTCRTMYNCTMYSVQCTLYTHVLHFFMVVEVFNNIDG